MPLVDLPLAQLETYSGTNPCPTDHAEYWERALTEMRSLPRTIELERATFQVPGADCFNLYFKGVRGARVHAKYLRPKAPAGRHPAIVEFHGYSGSSGDWSRKLGWLALGYSVISMDCRGQGGLSEDTGGTLGPTLNGHIIRGLADRPDNLLFRHIFLDTAQLASIVFELPEVDPERVGVTGNSQGGGLALACGALEPRIKRVVPVFPFLSDYQRVWEMDLAERAYAELKNFFRNHDPRHEQHEEWFRRLGYIDVQHLAPRIQGEVLMGISLMDNVCPPSTQFAAYNKVRAKKSHIIYPDFGHEDLPGFPDAIVQFMLKL
ncbi:MAG: acetylxylan esterase [Polyangiaceae bacterium]|nr:acetylxylan esterase [Polyangiaceae bacterium]